MTAATDLGRVREIVNHPLYRAALAAQIDYDSTSTGQRELDEAITHTNDRTSLEALLARKVAGQQLKIALNEQVALLPPVVHRGEPGGVEWSALSKARQALAHELARAAAETVLWRRPSPRTLVDVLVQFDRVVEAEVALGYKPAGWRNPRLLTEAGCTQRAPWLRYQRPVTPVDVPILFALGLEATWEATVGVLVATGDADAAFRWGYKATPGAVQQQWIVASAPDVKAWGKAARPG